MRDKGASSGSQARSGAKDSMDRNDPWSEIAG